MGRQWRECILSRFARNGRLPAVPAMYVELFDFFYSMDLLRSEAIPSYDSIEHEHGEIRWMHYAAPAVISWHMFEKQNRMSRINWNTVCCVSTLLRTIPSWKLERACVSIFTVPVAPPYQPKSYENLQQILNYDNAYDEPIALPVKYQYPRYMADERRKRAAANKNPFRWVSVFILHFSFHFFVDGFDFHGKLPSSNSRIQVSRWCNLLRINRKRGENVHSRPCYLLLFISLSCYIIWMFAFVTRAMSPTACSWLTEY